METPQPVEAYKKPLPEQSLENAAFWAGLKAGEFRIPRCRDCGRWNWVPLPACRECLSEELEWETTRGTGVIFTYTVVHRGLGAFNADGPYAVVMVEMDLDGPGSAIVMGNTVGIANEDLHIGMPVQVAYEPVEAEDITLWRFTRRD